MVTLITGDRVHVDAGGRVTRVQRAQGREGVLVSVKRVGDDTYVLPADAARLIGQGTLDRRLFNVSGLLRAEYDDAHRGTVPLIVSYTKQRAAAKSAIAAADVEVRRSLPAVAGEALSAPKTESPEVWDALTTGASGASGSSGSSGASGSSGSSGVSGSSGAAGSAGSAGQGREARAVAPGIARVWLDGKRTAALDRSVPQIGAPTAWRAGYDGSGVKVAVLDTGVDRTHPDLKGVAIAHKDFSGAGNTVDHDGHGTHVASTVAGSGAKSGGKYKGVAPGAKILSAKVLGDDGSGSDSGIIAGMQWAADQGAKVANLSLGSEDGPAVDPLEAAVDRISAEQGILFVIAAGNDGPDAGTVGSPGSAASALTVGAVDRADRIAAFSSVGPTADGSLKPDITAPGVGIVAAKAARSVGTPVAPGYVAMSGTSMATPHVSGAAAILAQRHPDWTGERIKQALTSSAKPTSGPAPFQQGTGRTDLAKAMTQIVVSEQTSVNFGTQQWPHTDDKPVTRQITYRNDGGEPVTLGLSPESTGPKGKPAPAGFFRTGADHVTVPPGGTASVGLTTNTRIDGPDGSYSGTLVAKAAGGGQSVRTTFGVLREAEAYDLTLKYVDTQGRPSRSGTTIVEKNVEFWQDVYDTDGDGVVKTRVPKGTYLLESLVQTPKGAKADPDVALMVRPRISVTKNSTVTFDARKAKPVKITVPESAKAVDVFVRYGFERAADSYYSSKLEADSFSGLRTGHVGPALSAKRFGSQLGGTWQKGSTTYNLLYHRTGSLHTGFSHKVAKSELALVKMRIGSSAKSRKGFISPTWELPSGTGSETVSRPFALPATAKTYLSAPKGSRWEFGVGQTDARGTNLDATFTESGPKVYLPRKTYGRTFNVGVFSPKVDQYNSARRTGNEFDFCIAEFTDGAGHDGESVTTKQRTVISVNGKKAVGVKGPLCGEFGGLPAKSATYRVSTDVTRSTKVAGVSTRLVAAWTFTSKKPAGDRTTTLPLSTVRFAPKLTPASTAKAGKRLTVPLTIQGPAAKKFKSLAVQVSYNGGKKWSKAPVTTKKGKRTLSLDHPKKATSVSLKAKFTDKSGNTYSITVVKAYLLT